MADDNNDNSDNTGKKASKQAIRVLTMLRLIMDGEGTLQNIREKNQCKRRSVYRDRELLLEHGFPVKYDKKLKRYVIENTGPSLLEIFSPEELTVMATMCEEVVNKLQMPFLQAGQDAAQKLLAAIPAQQREQVARLSNFIEFRLGSRMAFSESTKRHFQDFLDAYLQNKVLRVRYKSPLDSAEIVTLLSPYKLVYCRHSWYVVGRSKLFNATRTFHIGRVRKIEWTDQTYQIPARFSLDQYFGNAWHMIPEEGGDVEVVIRFSKRVAVNVAEIDWHRTQRVMQRPDGSVDMHLTVAGIREIVYWILSYGDDAEVIQPPSLKNLIIGKCTRTLQRYQEAEE